MMCWMSSRPTSISTKTECRGFAKNDQKLYSVDDQTYAIYISFQRHFLHSHSVQNSFLQLEFKWYGEIMVSFRGKRSSWNFTDEFATYILFGCEWCQKQNFLLFHGHILLKSPCCRSLIRLWWNDFSEFRGSREVTLAHDHERTSTCRSCCTTNGIFLYFIYS